MIVFKAHDAPIRSLRFSPDGTRVAVVAKDSVRLWPATGKGPPALFGILRPCSVDFSPDGRFLGSVGGRVRVWEAGRPDALLLDADGSAEQGRFSPSGDVFATQGSDRALCRWVVPSFARLPGGWGGTRESSGSRSFPTGAIAFSSDGGLLATSFGVLTEPRLGYDSVIRLWDAAGGEQKGELSCRFSTAHQTEIAFSPDGEHLAGIYGPNLRVWSTRERAEVARRQFGKKHLNTTALDRREALEN